MLSSGQAQGHTIVVFIELKDYCEAPFRPGVDEESIQLPHTTPNAIPSIVTTHSATPAPTAITPDATSDATSIPLPLPTLTPVPMPPVAVPPPARRSSRALNPSTRSADASGFNKISAVQRATQESMASKACLNKEKKTGRRSRQSS
jgi:hypothetical protein